MLGKLYGVGVGPGDPELMTLKAVNRIRSSSVIAFPGKDARDAVAYSIAIQSVPEMKDKVLLPLYIPMVSDKDRIAEAHEEAVYQIETHLAAGEDVVFLVLGDVTVYSSYMYLHKKISARGYDTEVVSGVTSFCAAAATCSMSLCQWDEQLVIVPSRHQIPDDLEEGKNYVFMKAGNHLSDIRMKAIENNRDAVCIENCGMENERIYIGVDNIPDQAGYYAIVIIK